MPDIYPYISDNQSQNIGGFISYTNQVTDGLFMPLILLGIFIITFVVTMIRGPARAFMYSTFFCSILAIFFTVGGWLNPIYMYLLFVMLGVSLMILRLSKSSPLPQI